MTLDARWQVLIALTTARAAMGFQFQSVAVTAPLLSDQLGFDLADIGWLVGLYLLPGALFSLPGGMLGARFGDRRIAVLGLVAMAAGGLLLAVASDLQVAAAGRVISGAGGVLLNVVLVKMVTDWFAGRELVLAIAVLMNAWPIGIAVALLTLGGLATATSPQVAFAATSVFALAGIALVLLFHRPAPSAAAVQAVSLRLLNAREWRLLAVGSLPWMLYNAAFALFVAFLPTWFVRSGMPLVQAGAFTAISTVLMVGSVQLGGMLAQRYARPDRIAAAGILGWCAMLVALLHGGPPLAWLVFGGAVVGLPVGVLASVPAQFLRPETRSTGMGVFYTLYYLGIAGFPPVAGWAAQRVGGASAPLYVALGALVATLLALAATRWMQRSG